MKKNNQDSKQHLRPRSSQPNGAHSSSPVSAASQFDPWVLWVTFRRCWGWALPVGAVMAGLACFVVLRNFVPTYKATSLLEANQDFVVFQGVMPMVKDLARTETSLFYNAIVLDPVLADPELRRAPSLSNPDRAEQNLRRNLSINSGGTSSRLVVSYEDSDREAAAMVCNAVVESYLRQRDAFDSTRVNNLERWLEPEIQRWEQEVGDRRRNVQNLSKQSLGYAPGQAAAIHENDSALAFVSRLRSQITDLTVEISVRDAQIAMQGDTDPNDASLPNPKLPSRVSDRPVTGAAPSSTELQLSDPRASEIDRMVALDPQVREASAMVDRYRAITLNMEDNDLVRIRREYYNEQLAKVAQWERRLAEAKLAARQPAIEKFNQLAEEESERAESNQKLSRDQMVTKLSVLQDQYEQELTRLEQFGGTTAELQFAQEELAVANDVLKQLRDRVAAIRTERRQDGAVRTLASATPPNSPTSELPIKKMIMTGGATMMIPLLIGLLWELRVQRITDSSMCGELSVVGEVARLPAGTRSVKGRRIFEESVDSLRANLFLSTRWKETRSIAVVSGISGEGKSSVASQLSLSIAKATGETVLLVDADLRCPDQHRLFGLEMGPGLSAVLAGKATLKEAVDTSLGGQIHLLPAGQLSASPHRLMSPERLQTFMGEALDKYTYVVIDTSPVLSAGETLAIAATVESTLLCVMRDVSRVDSIRQTTRRLEAAGASLIGTVFSGVTSRQYAYRYGDYHYAMSGGDFSGGDLLESKKG